MSHEHANSEMIVNGAENAESFAVGHEVMYGTRVYKIDAIHGDEADITAPETIQEILSPEYHGTRSMSAADLEKYKGGLTGSPYTATLADGEVVHKQKMIFPEEKHRVKLSELTHT